MIASHAEFSGAAMKKNIAGMVACVALSAIFIIPTSSAEVSPSMSKKIYDIVEKATREDFDLAQQGAIEEKQRKVKAGLPPLSSEETRKGDSALQFILYNKAYNHFVCAEKASEHISSGDSSRILERCSNERHRHFLKFLKMTDDPSAFDLQKIVKCQIKTRDYDGEQRFPPFDFLKGWDNAKLFEFEALNECILASL